MYISCRVKAFAFFRSIVNLNKLSPLASEKSILDKHYGKTKRFTIAVNKMKTVLRNIDKEARLISSQQTIDVPPSNDDDAHSAKDQEAKPTETLNDVDWMKEINRKQIKIILTRLTQSEIDHYCRKKENKTIQPFTIQLRKRTRIKYV